MDDIAYSFGTGDDLSTWHTAASLDLGSGEPDAVVLDFDGDGLYDDAMWDSDGDLIADTAVLDVGPDAHHYTDPSGLGLWDQYQYVDDQRTDDPLADRQDADRPSGIEWHDVAGAVHVVADSGEQLTPVDFHGDGRTNDAVVDIDGDGRADGILIGSDDRSIHRFDALVTHDQVLVDRDGNGVLDDSQTTTWPDASSP